MVVEEGQSLNWHLEGKEMLPFPVLEELRDAWLVAPDAAAQARIGIEMQRQAFIDVPYVPLGVFYQPTAYRKELTGVLKGLPLFWNVRRA